MLMKILSTLKKIIKSKLKFLPPKKLKTLIWGVPSHLELLKEKKYKIDFNKTNLIHVWGEEYNLFILFKCLINLKFSFLEYSREYIRYTKAKVIITFLDNYISAYKLRTNASQKLIIIQNAWRSDEYNFFKKKIKEKPKIDYLLLQNKNLIKKYKNICTSKFLPIGSFISNHVPIANNKKKYELLYISTFRKLDFNKIIYSTKTLIENARKSEEIILKILYKYCFKNKIKFYVLPSRKPDIVKEQTNFIKKHTGNKCKIINRPYSDNVFAYNVIDSSKIVVGIDSTLMYEAFGRGVKTVFCNIRPADKFLKRDRYFGWPKKFPPQGPFWSNQSDYDSISQLIKKVLKYNHRQWTDIKRKYSEDLMPYDKNNSSFLKTLKI